MLVLRRKPGQRITIDGGRIVITYLGGEAGGVNLGIEAPREIEVHREEVQERINRERGLPCVTAK